MMLQSAKQCASVQVAASITTQLREQRARHEALIAHALAAARAAPRTVAIAGNSGCNARGQHSAVATATGGMAVTQAADVTPLATQLGVVRCVCSFVYMLVVRGLRPFVAVW
jgi:hypothetical protein